MEPPKPPSPSEAEQPHQDSDYTNANPESNTKSNENDTKKSSHAIDNFKALVMEVALASAKTKSSLTPSHTLLLEQRFNEFFPHFHTPDHPPYAAMIHSAIEQLNEGGGSSEEAISEFVKENYNDLPWAHDALLKHHLRELCKSGDIVETRNRCYLLGGVGTGINPISSPSPSSSAGTSPSPSLGLSSSSISCSSSSSSFSTGPCLKRKRLNRKQRKAQGRKKGRPCKRRAKGEETLLSLTEASVRRRGRPSKKDGKRDEVRIDANQTDATEKQDLMLQLRIGVTEEEEYQLKEPDEFQEEQNPVKSEECGSNEQSGKDNTEIDSEPREQEDQYNKKRGRKKCRAHKKSVQGKEILQMLTSVPGSGRGRPRRKLVFEEMQTITEDMEATKLGDPMIQDKTDRAHEENHPVEEQNEVTEEQNKVLGKQFEITEHNQAEGTKNVVTIVPHYYEDKVEEGLVERQKQKVVSGNGNKDEVIEERNHLIVHVIKVTEEQNKSLQLEKEAAIEKFQQQGQEAKKAKQQDVLMEGQIKATSGQNLPREDHEGPKKRRGRPPKGSGSGKEIQRKRPRVPGRKRGRPRKNDVLKEETQMTVEQIEETELHDLNVKDIIGVTEEENEPKQEPNWVNGEQNQVHGKQFEISEQNLAGEINVVIDTEPHGQEDMVCEEWSEENEQEREVSVVHNQSEVIEEQIEPGERLIEVIDKQIQLQEQDDVIGRQNFLKGSEMVEEVNRLKDKNEQREQAEVAEKENLLKEKNEESPRKHGSDAECNKHEVEGNETSEEYNQCGKSQDDIGEEQNQHQQHQYDHQNQQFKEQKESITEKEIEVAEMEYQEALIQERNQLNRHMKLKRLQADADLVAYIDHNSADIPKVSSGSSTEKRKENFLEKNRKQQVTGSSENEENCDTCSKQTRQILGIASVERSSDLQSTEELFGVQLPEKMTVEEESESRQLGFQTPKFEPAGGTNTVVFLSSHSQVEEQNQLDADGKAIPPALGAATIVTKEWSLPDYQQDGQEKLLQQAQEKASGMTTAATMEELVPLEHQKGSSKQQKVQSKKQGQERPPKLRRSFRHMQGESRSKA